MQHLLTLYSSRYNLQTTTFYAWDLAGNSLAVYNLPSGGNIVQTDLSIFGLSRLGVYNRATAQGSYEITDHLGNVRAVIRKENNIPAIKSFADYYRFGELLPGTNSLNYLYAFQGQELDTETNIEAFQLRLWDGRIGKWLSPDPYGELIVLLAPNPKTPKQALKLINKALNAIEVKHADVNDRM